VPASGPVLLAPNHFSQMDHFFAAVYLRRKVRFMAKSQLFGPPVLTSIYRHGGVFPVRRGHRDEEAFKTAYTILDRGGAVLVYAEGGGPAPQPRRAAAGHRQARARVRRPGRPGRDPRIRRGPRLAQAALPEGDGPVRRAGQLPAEQAPSRERQLEVAGEVFDRVRSMYTALEEKGRRGVIRSLRDQIPAPTRARLPRTPSSSSRTSGRAARRTRRRARA
jgi:1-acyl-sn-glycerol-3-phosphate acyltransferase